MLKAELLKQANDVRAGLCQNCGQTCKLNGYEPCMEKKAMGQLIKFAEKYMNDYGTALAPGIYDRR